MPAGRPTDYNLEIADFICEELMSGRSLRQICDVDGMPDRITVIRWMGRFPEFATKCAQARDEQADLMDDKILEVANEVLTGKLDPHAAKVAISAYQWRASKLKAKKYGDHKTVDHKITIDTVDEAIAAIESQLRLSAPEVLEGEIVEVEMEDGEE